MATLKDFAEVFGPLKEIKMANTKPLEIEGTIKAIKDYDNRRVISIGPYYGKTAIAAWFNKFEGEDEKALLMTLGEGTMVKIEGYTTSAGWHNASAIEIIQDVHQDLNDDAPVNSGQANHYSDKDAQIARSVAIKEASSWATAMLMNGKTVTSEDVLKMADTYAHYIITGER